jgi:WD40 repeat protein
VRARAALCLGFISALTNHRVAMVSFGHQEGVTSLDALSRERCLTCGGRDRTARLWKIPEESQLVYRGAAASMDVVRWVADDCFVSGDDQGCVCRADSGRMGRP